MKHAWWFKIVIWITLRLPKWVLDHTPLWTVWVDKRRNMVRESCFQKWFWKKALKED
jgi:hypothetical protein